LWFATNHKPVIRGTDDAIWRGLRLVPFDVTIPEAEQDRRLLDKLQAERPGILRWAVEGCLAWQRDGLGTPDEVREATASYSDEMDYRADFFAEHCVIDPSARVTAAALYARYQEWAATSGEKTSLSKKALAGPLRERGFKPAKVDRARGWCGLRLREAQDRSLAETDLDAFSRNFLKEGSHNGNYRNMRPDPSQGQIRPSDEDVDSDIEDPDVPEIPSEHMDW